MSLAIAAGRRKRPAGSSPIVYAPIAAELAEAERIFAGRAGEPLPVRATPRRPLRRLPRQAAPARAGPARRARPAAGSTPAHPVLAAVVEMIHTATLVHDDILDEAVIRRHAATVNAEWGNETAVLLGDYLFTHAFHLAASLDSTLACRWIGRATNLVCEGEMQQVHNRGNLDLDEDAYFAIIRGKTAELTAVSLPARRPLRRRPRGDRRGAGGLRPRPRRRLPDRRRRARHLGRGADDRQEPGHRPGEAEADAPPDPPARRRPARDRRARPPPARRGPARAPPRDSAPTSKALGALDYAWDRAQAPRHPGARRPRRASPTRTPRRSSASSRQYVVRRVVLTARLDPARLHAVPPRFCRSTNSVDR